MVIDVKVIDSFNQKAHRLWRSHQYQSFRECAKVNQISLRKSGENLKSLLSDLTLKRCKNYFFSEIWNVTSSDIRHTVYNPKRIFCGSWKVKSNWISKFWHENSLYKIHTDSLFKSGVINIFGFWQNLHLMGITPSGILHNFYARLETCNFFPILIRTCWKMSESQNLIWPLETLFELLFDWMNLIFLLVLF